MGLEMSARRRNQKSLLSEAAAGTRIQATKNQGYQLPLPLWQELVSEVARRKALGLECASQNAVAVAAITKWLEENRGGE